MSIKFKYSRIIILGMMILIVGATSCIKTDNYPGPAETVTGTVYDSVTGKPMQVEMNGIRIELLELSWKATPPSPNPYFYTDNAGFYNNTKIFSGYYNLNINGPFVPLNHKLWPSPNTDTTDLSINTTIKGVVKKDFTVDPILEVSWVQDPVYNKADSTISATVIITSGTKNPLFQKPVTDINLYLCEVPYPGDGNRDGRYSAFHGSTVLSNNHFVLGQPYTIKSIGKVTPRTWWVRVGSRTNVALPTGRPFNYSTIKAVTVQ